MFIEKCVSQNNIFIQILTRFRVVLPCTSYSADLKLLDGTLRFCRFQQVFHTKVKISLRPGAVKPWLQPLLPHTFVLGE